MRDVAHDDGALVKVQTGAGYRRVEGQSADPQPLAPRTAEAAHGLLEPLAGGVLAVRGLLFVVAPQELLAGSAEEVHAVHEPGVRHADDLGGHRAGRR